MSKKSVFDWVVKTIERIPAYIPSEDTKLYEMGLGMFDYSDILEEANKKFYVKFENTPFTNNAIYGVVSAREIANEIERLLEMKKGLI